ncbi:head GIN domain-containing protein [Capnocytophaga haemolytica]|jgi:hypothetical protein
MNLKNVINDERNLPLYTSVIVKGSLDIVLTEGNVGKVKVSALESNLPYVLTEVSEGVLSVTLDEAHPPKDLEKVVVSVPVDGFFKGVSLVGTGEISTETTLATDRLEVSLAETGDINLSVNVESLSVRLEGEGDIRLKGEAKNFTAVLNGSGDVKAEALKAQDATLLLDGSGDISAYVTHRVEATLNGKGDIKVNGNPQERNVNKHGKGDIKIK